MNELILVQRQSFSIFGTGVKIEKLSKDTQIIDAAQTMCKCNASGTQPKHKSLQGISGLLSLYISSSVCRSLVYIFCFFALAHYLNCYQDNCQRTQTPWGTPNQQTQKKRLLFFFKFTTSTGLDILKNLVFHQNCKYYILQVGSDNGKMLVSVRLVVLQNDSVDAMNRPRNSISMCSCYQELIDQHFCNDHTYYTVVVLICKRSLYIKLMVGNSPNQIN